MMRGALSRILLLPIIFLTGLSACGFQPMLADTGASDSIRRELASIEVGPMPDRLGQIVRNGLVSRLNPGSGERTSTYRLEVALAEEREGFGFREDESITRLNYQLQALYRLRDVSTGEILTEGTVRSNMAYDVVQSDFANFSADQDAQLRTADQIVGIIATRLALYFKSAEDGE